MRRNGILTGCAVCVGMALAQPRPALGGWSGQMNGAGVGRANANVTSATAQIGTVTDLKQTVGGNPLSAAVSSVNPVAGYNKSILLPNGSSASTAALIKGLSGYVWQASTAAVGGDKTDNPVIEALIAQNIISVTPQPNAFLEIDAKIVGSTLQVQGIATGGTAALLRGFTWNGPQPPTDEDLQRIAAGELFDFSFTILGEGRDPTLPGSAFIQSFEIPTIPNPDNFFLITEGFATSAVPDGGSLGLLLGTAFAGLALARRRL